MMKRKVWLYLSMGVLCLAWLSRSDSCFGTGMWTSNGPYGGGTVECMTLSTSQPDVMYVSTFTYGGGGGLFVSIDGGEHWERLAIPAERFRSIGVDPNSAEEVYAASRRTIYRSTDGGKGWSEMMRLDPSVDIRSITVDPTRSGVVYAATTEWVFKTTDRGVTWTHLDGFPDKIPSGSRYARGYFNAAIVTVNPEDPEELYVGTNPGAYRSQDGGISWSRMGPKKWWRSSDVSVYGILVDPRDPNRIYCNTTDGGYRSTDRGRRWEQLHYFANDIIPVAVDPSTGDVYASSSSRLFRSSDQGGNWTEVLEDLRHDALSGVLIHPRKPEILYTVDDRGLLKTTDGGDTWRRIDRGFNNTTIFSIAVHPSSGEVFAAAGNRGIYKSSDEGRTWEKTSNTSVSKLVFDPESGDMYGSGWDILKSTDGGVTWRPSGRGLPYMAVAVLAVDPFNPNVLLAAGTEDWEGEASGVYRSTDRGNTWIEANDGLSLQPDVWSLVMDPVSPGIVYVGTYTDGVYKSLDGGLSWSRSSEGLTERWVLSLAINETSPDVVYAGTPNGIFRSSDAGAHWSETSMTRGPVRTLLVHPRRNGWVYAGGDMGVYGSRDGGVLWEELNEGLLARKVWTLAMDPVSDILYAGTAGGGVYQRHLSSWSEEPVTGVVGPDASSWPCRYELLPNAPNPFNAETTIQYALPAEGRIMLAIYNTMGQRVRTFVKGVQVAGHYHVAWDGRDETGQAVATGVYVCRLEARKHRDARKMLLLK